MVPSIGKTGTAYIEPGSPWQNAYVESFNARLRDELLNAEVFTTLAEAQAPGRRLARGLQRPITLTRRLA